MTPLDVDSPSVQSHLTMLQGIIERLASNSASCKTWCVSLVSAIAVVAAQASKVELIFVAVLPIVVFAVLDAYYLGLERRFRLSYEGFVRKLHEGTARIDDVFVVAPKASLAGFSREVFQAFSSFSIWPFYIGLALVLAVLARRLVGSG